MENGSRMLSKTDVRWRNAPSSLVKSIFADAAKEAETITIVEKYKEINGHEIFQKSFSGNVALAVTTDNFKLHAQIWLSMQREPGVITKIRFKKIVR